MTIAELWAYQIIQKKRDFDEVPKKLRNEVKAIISFLENNQ